MFFLETARFTRTGRLLPAVRVYKLCEGFRFGGYLQSASPVSNVSDTARWVAVYRAWESARPDALFNDPYAKSLAGERGQAIAKLMPAQARSGWPMIARTRLIDDLVQAAVAQGCDCVINLAAGLDTRPYRLIVALFAAAIALNDNGLYKEAGAARVVLNGMARRAIH